MDSESINREIAELKDTVRLLNEKLKDSESLKSNFISNIMNEVYNPFSSIMTLADNIISLDDTNLSRSREMARFIYKEASKLDFHLQNIFTAATIEAGLEDIENKTVNIDLIHEEVLRKLKIDILSKDIDINYSKNFADASDFITDPKKLILIITNIISNSIKFCPEGGKIQCRYEIIEDILNITISDNGSGISGDEINEIYDRFTRTNTNINSVTGGTGLGLSVVKALLDLMDGNIDIESKDGTIVMISISQGTIMDDEMDDSVLFDEEIF